MSGQTILAVYLVAALGAGCAPHARSVIEVPTGRAADDELRINDTRRFQVLDGVGACSWAFPYANDIGWNWKAVKYVFDELNLRYVRLGSWFGFWEKNNDNADPNVIDWKAFGSTIIDTHDVAFARWLSDRGVEVSLGVWGVADWLAGGRPRQISPRDYPELGESISAYVLNMKRHGVVQWVTEVQNEPGIEASIRYAGPEALRDAALAVLDKFDHFGLSDMRLHGPNADRPRGAAEWAQVWLQDERLRSRTAALSYHTWWDDDFASFDAIRIVAERYGKAVWATEVGYCALSDGCFGGTHTLRPETWGTAWDYAESYYRAIAWSRASRVYHWAILGFDGAVTPTGGKTPTFFVLKHFSNFIAPGARLVETAAGNAALHALAFVAPSGERTLIVLNTGVGARTTRLVSARGDALSSVQAVTTTEDRFEAPTQLSGAPSGKQLSVTLPPRSITSIRFR